MMSVRMPPMVGDLSRAMFPRSMSVLVAIDAMFVDSARLATMFFAAASTLSSADKGGGEETGGNEGEFMVTNNFTLSSTLPIGYALVRAKPLPLLGKILLLSFKKRFQGAFVEGNPTVFSQAGDLYFLGPLLSNTREWRKCLKSWSNAEDDVFLPPTLTLIFRATKIPWALFHGASSRFILA